MGERENAAGATSQPWTEGVGSRVGNYLLVAPRGSGGTGIVFEAQDTRDGSRVAVKVAHDTKGWQRELLRREIALMVQLSRHEGQADPTGKTGIIRLLEHGADAHRVWYAMELIHGVDLGRLTQILTSGPRLTITLAGNEKDSSEQGPRERNRDVVELSQQLGLFADEQGSAYQQQRLSSVVQLIARIARTLARVHALGIVHADLAPANIIVRTDGTPVLIDFGTSFYTFVDGVAREGPHRQGIRHGTPGYMAPEQIRGNPLDARCDLYALGCIFYELLVGRPPFVGDTPTVLRLHLEAEVTPPSVSVPELPAAIDDVVLGLLHKDPTRRTGFAEDVVASLGPWLTVDAAVAESAVVSVAPTAPATPTMRLYRSRLHGRTTALASLGERLKRALTSQGSLVLASGESGLGKTRLLNELGAWAARLGMNVVFGQCRGSSEQADGFPLEPLLPVLRQLGDQLFLKGEAVTGTMADALAALLPFEPTLQAVPGASALELPALPPELARDRVLRGLLTCLRALAERQPLLLLIDDLQWADELTQAFVTTPRLRELAQMPLVIVGTYREEEVDAGFAATFDRSCDEHVRLGRLEREDIAALARDMTASAMLPEGLVDDVFRASEGNPFFAAECLRAGLDLGIYRRDESGRWHATSPASAHAGYEAGGRSLGRYLLPRLARLSPAARSVAEVAAVLGRELEEQALLSLLPDGDVTRAALEELVAQRLLEEPSPGKLRFVHDKLREWCEEQMSAGQRRAAHRTAALALEELHGKTPPAALAAQLGRHWRGAEEPERAAHHLESAARAFAEVHAIREASELYRQALQQWESAAQNVQSAQDVPHAPRTGTPFAAERAALGEALGDLLALRAKHLEARECFQQAAAWQPPDHRLTRARLLRKSGRSFWTVHQYDDATHALAQAQALLDEPPGTRDALELAREQSEQIEQIEISQNQFWNAYFGRRLGPTVDALLARMDAETADHGTVRQRGIYEKCAAMYKMVLARFRSSPEVIEHSRRSLALLESDPAYAVDALEARFSLGFALVTSQVSDCQEALPLFLSSADVAEGLGDMTNLARALAYATIALRRLDKGAETVAMAERLQRTAEEAQLLPYLGVACSCLAWAAWRQSERHGDEASQNARRRLEEARTWWARAGHPFPFRWLAELVAVGLAADADDPLDAAEPLAVLGRADQFHLPDALDRAVTAAREACASRDVETAQRALQAALAEARKAGF